jgi:hypothetical protein
MGVKLTSALFVFKALALAVTTLEEAKAALVKAQAAVDGQVGSAMAAVSTAKSRVHRLVLYSLPLYLVSE